LPRRDVEKVEEEVLKHASRGKGKKRFFADQFSPVHDGGPTGGLRRGGRTKAEIKKKRANAIG